MSNYPYPRYARVWPMSAVFFKGFEYGHEAGIRRGRFQMGDYSAYEDGGTDAVDS